VHRAPKVHTQDNRTLILKADKLRKKEYNIMRREKREMERNDVDVGRNVPINDQPIAMNDPIDVGDMGIDNEHIPTNDPKFSVSQYVTVLPCGTLKGKSFWGFQGVIQHLCRCLDHRGG
jgi:hypothetical protein